MPTTQPTGLRRAPEAMPEPARLATELEELAALREPDRPGWTRRVFSEPDQSARRWVADRMRQAGLHVDVDAAGNVVGTLPGSGGGGPALVSGSHLDTVDGGGRFDGMVGVLGALEVARCLQASGRPLRHDLRVVSFCGEEPNAFGLSCVGSRAVAGTLTAEHLALTDPQGRTLAAALAAAGGDPERAWRCAWRPEAVHAYCELHIEQGPRLEAAGVPIGVVQAIAGLHRCRASFTGRADHAGTMPMTRRRDALCAAAEWILALEASAQDGDGVATAGRVTVAPGAVNVVPQSAVVSAELRSVDAGWLAERHPRLAVAAQAAGRARGVEAVLHWLSAEPPTPCAPAVQAAVRTAAQRRGQPTLDVPSGAGHDAVPMAHLGPVGMLFVPSREGRSHCPEEWTDLDAIVTGVAVLLEALRELDGVADCRGPRPAG